jgi:2,4-dienoyl-CoA reductase (NADPH2)
MEAARVAASRGHRVRLVERSSGSGGRVRPAAAGAGRNRLVALVDWLDAECRAEGVDIQTGTEIDAADLATWDGEVVLATGSRTGVGGYAVGEGATVLPAADLLTAVAAGQVEQVLPTEQPVVVWDPIGGPIGVSVAELLASQGRSVTYVTPDNIVGTLLSLTGDLAPANARLAQQGVDVVKRATLRAVDASGLTVEDRFTAERRTLTSTVLVDAGPRLADDGLWRESGSCRVRVGDAVAPRTIGEAVLEGRRAALALDGIPATAAHGQDDGATSPELGGLLPAGAGSEPWTTLAGSPSGGTWHRPVSTGTPVAGRGRDARAQGATR